MVYLYGFIGLGLKLGVGMASTYTIFHELRMFEAFAGVYANATCTDVRRNSEIPRSSFPTYKVRA